MRKSPGPLRKRGLYRPTAVMLIVHKDGSILLVSHNGRTNLSLPQGGIEKGESIKRAAYRESKEEVRISKKQLELVDDSLFFWITGMPQADSTSLRGFWLGKSYFGVFFKYAGPKALKVNEKEISGYRWVPPKSVRQAMCESSKDKQEMVRWALIKAKKLRPKLLKSFER